MINSFIAGATLDAERIVCLTAANTANYAASQALTGTGSPVLGITVDYADSGKGVPVAGWGEIAPLYFNDTVAACGLVASDANGYGVPLNTVANLTNTAWVVGLLLDAAVAATGTIAKVLVMPQIAMKKV
jgi:hypothetical protein